MTSVLVALIISQSPYVRTRTDDLNANSQCLWWVENTSIVFHQNADGNPETPGDTEFTAVAKSFATWQTQMDTCGNLTLSEGPRTNSRLVGYDEGKTGNENIVLFRQTRCTVVAASSDACWKDDNCGNTYDCWQHSDSAIAITTTSYNPSTGRILDSDIELNVPSFVFTTVDFPPCCSNCVPPVFNETCVATDVQNTVTHEAGHLLGLGHISNLSSTMSPRADPGELSKRVLDPGSKQFICDAYPKGKPSRGCIVMTASDALGQAPSCSSTALPGLGGLLALAFLRNRRER